MHVLGLGVAVDAQRDAEALDLGREPLRDAEQILAPRRPRREHDLPARFARRLEHDDLVTTQRRDPRRFQAGRPRPHHHDLAARTGPGLDHVRHRPLAPRRGVVQAERIPTDVDAIEAVAGADAGADPVLLAPHHLRDDVRVRHVGARHGHHVDVTFAHAVLRRRKVRDPGGVEDGEPGLALHRGRDVHEGRPRPGHARNGLGQSALVAHLPRDHVHEVAHAGVGVDLREREAVVLREPALLQLVPHHPESDEEVVPDPPAYLLQHFQTEPSPVPEAPAVLVGPAVDERRPELVDEMPLGEELGAVEPAFLAAPRGIAERAHHPPDVVAVHLLRERAMRMLAHHRGGERRQPVLHVPQRAVAHVRDLAHDGAAVPVHALGELPEHGDNRVVADVDLAEGGWRVRRDVRRTPEHGEREPSLRLLLVVELIPKLRVPVLNVPGGMAGAHDPVPERHVAKPERLQKAGVPARTHGRCLPGSVPES